ncbi:MULTISPECIES: amidohydrolase [Pontibacillus]|uniref:Amidohydrolase n=1 Tax=Pontibacillus chungwhensis TaxID=265426 RepID=A0ABY8UY80_9BACI|nr:amidohydrolase [Pontibacillus chungwhensis]MCD5324233.1 amidohydrolase [Pontibacillus sp. HN14]WIF97711.1 amidohydrolase [Pontibacillus chungwhensis]
MSNAPLNSILVDWRRALHEYPELGFTEYVTTYRVGKELEALGFTVFLGKEALSSESRKGVPRESILHKQEQAAREWGVEEEWLNAMKGGHTGLVATWETGRPGPHKAFRFDIDALPINETKDPSHIPFHKGFHSKVDGVMHACGHDGHTAIGVALAHFISREQDALSGKLTLLFQPAEEGGRGAKAMTDQGWLHNVDEFYTGHIGIHSMPVGTVGASVKGFLASSKMNVTYKGRSAHAGMKPEEGRNALLAAATASTQLYAIPRHSGGASRVNVGRLEAGSGRNVIADHGYLELETRGENHEVHCFVHDEATRMIRSVADLYDVSCEIDEVGETSSFSCSEEAVEWIKEWGRDSPVIEEIIPVVSVSGSEDASFMVNEVKGHDGIATYMLFGTPLAAGHHHPSFDFDEGALAVALDMYITIAKGGTGDAKVARRNVTTIESND